MIFIYQMYKKLEASFYIYIFINMIYLTWRRLWENIQLSQNCEEQFEEGVFGIVFISSPNQDTSWVKFSSRLLNRLQGIIIHSAGFLKVVLFEPRPHEFASD